MELPVRLVVLAPRANQAESILILPVWSALLDHLDRLALLDQWVFLVTVGHRVCLELTVWTVSQVRWVRPVKKVMLESASRDKKVNQAKLPCLTSCVLGTCPMGRVAPRVTEILKWAENQITWTC